MVKSRSTTRGMPPRATLSDGVTQRGGSHSHLSQPQFNVSGGEEIIAEFRDRRPKKADIRRSDNQPFDAEIVSGSGEVQAHHAEAIIRSLLPIWLIPIFAVLLLAAAGIGISLITPSGGESNSSIPDTSSCKYAGCCGCKTDPRGRLQHLSHQPKTYYQTTAAAVTATANWLVGDSDNDGLTNQEELAYRTAPDNPDTDRDGLNDHEEIFQWHTDPLRLDTDGDRIGDGDEVDQGLDPLRADTDETAFKMEMIQSRCENPPQPSMFELLREQC